MELMYARLVFHCIIHLAQGWPALVLECRRVCCFLLLPSNSCDCNHPLINPPFNSEPDFGQLGRTSFPYHTGPPRIRLDVLFLQYLYYYKAKPLPCFYVLNQGLQTKLQSWRAAMPAGFYGSIHVSLFRCTFSKLDRSQKQSFEKCFNVNFNLLAQGLDHQC